MKLYVVVEWNITHYEFLEIRYYLDRNKAQKFVDEFNAKNTEYACRIEEREVEDE
jgi:hypothetical protein